MVARAGRIGVVAMLCALADCASEPPPPQPVFASVVKSAPVRFQYQLIDGKGWLGAETMHGRPSLIGFITTYDMASQAQARFLNGILQKHVGKVQVAAIVLERADNRPLVIAFRDGLGLGFPVAMGDADLIGGRGPFGDVHAVPATVLLDTEGRLVWKKLGLATEEEIEKALREL